MQAKNGWIIATIVIMGLIVLLGNYLMIPEQQEIVIPTAQEISDLIVIPDFPVIPQNVFIIRENLKETAINLCDEEMYDENFEYSKYKEVVVVKEFEEDRIFSEVHLGIDRVDSREVVVERTFKLNVDGDYEIKTIKCQMTSDDGDLEAKLI